MKRILRKWYITVREESDDEDRVRFGTSVVAFTPSEAIEEVSKLSKFNGGPQGHPNNNWNPKYPLIFEAKEQLG